MPLVRASKIIIQLLWDWFRKSADQDIAQAQYNLGVFYENGYGVDADIQTAKDWYEKAALQNLPEAKAQIS